MHLTSPAIGGAILAELFAAAIVTMLATATRSIRAAMLAGLAAALPALGLLVPAETRASVVLPILSTTAAGAGLAMGYRGSLGIVNAIAPADARAGVVSAYLSCCFTGNSLPVIGGGVVTVARGAATASTIFAGAMAVLALGAFAIGWQLAPKD